MAKNGTKLSQGNCVVVDEDHPAPTVAPGEKKLPVCDSVRMNRRGLNRTVNATGLTMKELCDRVLSDITSRTVIDKTGIAGKFDIHLEWTDVPLTTPAPGGADDPAKPAQTDATGPTLFTALQEQLGLKLESGKGPVQVLVIDRVERPEGN